MQKKHIEGDRVAGVSYALLSNDQTVVPFAALCFSFKCNSCLAVIAIAALFHASVSADSK